ncbi:MAG: ATP-dependent DNA helicase [Christensenellales bacterium]
MADLLRLSVRGLVGFSVFPPDIQPLPASLMEEGRAAHLARQKISGAQREAALNWRGKVEGVEVLVTGRMDLFDGMAEPPLIEEIKLCGEEAPTEPRREHLYQALCYGFMQGTAAPRPAFQIRVSYVDRAGTLRAAFEETWRFEALQAVFMELLLPCVSWHKRLMAARARRDKSLESLPFPYPDYRAGQREMAAQVYTAISRRRRLFAVMPTGTGKSAAVLYPAFKALGLHLTGQIFCLTARTTAREAMEKEAQRMRGLGLKARVLTLNAKEKLCPQIEMRCDPVHCPRAKGHYERQPAGLLGALRRPLWDTAGVLSLAERFQLCPFEFSLALCEVADAVICDYNYFLDPRLRIKRIFEQPGEVTVLIDEAHNLPGRVGDMLSGDLDSAAIALMRREAGAALGRKGKLYRQATRLLACLRGLAPDALAPPDVLLPALEELMAALSAQPQFPIDPALIRDILGFMDALKRRAAAPVDYLLLCQEKGKERSLRLLCLNITPHLHKATARLAGLVCYSATLAPLQQMRALLGGAEEDACFELPSPFPGEHMLTLQLPLDTRYQQRERSLLPIADALRALCLAKPGKYIAFFPSYQYMQDVALLLQDLPLHVQQGGMDDKARAEYLARFSLDGQPLLALAVLGGVFAEGIDLPGLKLIGVCVVGVGLPQVNRQREAIRERAEGQGMDGFDVAYRHPGMHKVLQAAGRLIRSQDDRGVLLLLDERFQQPAYRRLLPGHWQVRALKNVAQMTDALQEFWSR